MHNLDSIPNPDLTDVEKELRNVGFDVDKIDTYLDAFAAGYESALDAAYKAAA